MLSSQRSLQYYQAVRLSPCNPFATHAFGEYARFIPRLSSYQVRSHSTFASTPLHTVTEGNIILNHYNELGAQPLMPPVDPVVVDGMEPLLRPVVASPQQVSASKKRRRSTVLGKFVCQLCSQDFTAKHNLQSQQASQIILAFFFRDSDREIA